MIRGPDPYQIRDVIWHRDLLSLRSIQLKLVKIGARVIYHSRRTVFQLAEVAVIRGPVLKVLARIHG